MEIEEIKRMDFLEKDEIKSIEKHIEKESESILQLSKRFFWNNLIIIFFAFYGAFYITITEYPKMLMIMIALAAVIISSLERLWLQNKIKNAASRLAVSITMLEILKKIK